jgi:hypothetical protein
LRKMIITIDKPWNFGGNFPFLDIDGVN